MNTDRVSTRLGVNSDLSERNAKTTRHLERCVGNVQEQIEIVWLLWCTYRTWARGQDWRKAKGTKGRTRVMEVITYGVDVARW